VADSVVDLHSDDEGVVDEVDFQVDDDEDDEVEEVGKKSDFIYIIYLHFFKKCLY
jgi:hypothetical protein